MFSFAGINELEAGAVLPDVSRSLYVLESVLEEIGGVECITGLGGWLPVVWFSCHFA